MVNACLDLARRRRRRPIEVEIMPIDAPSMVDVAREFAERQMLDEALQRLDVPHRAVVVLHYFVGLPLPEVATALGIPAGTARSRLHHSLAAMRVSLARDVEPRPAPVMGGHPA
jgi:RNA polymerase sigma-70 factor (ECF subfamily)